MSVSACVCAYVCVCEDRISCGLRLKVWSGVYFRSF